MFSGLKLGSRRILLESFDSKCDALSTDPIVGNYQKRATTARRWLATCQHSLSIAIVFAMWRESPRLRPKSIANPLGENALVSKCEELQWLFANTEISWRIYAVDDGCPDGSAEVAASAVRGTPFEKHVTVLKLEDALPSKIPPLQFLRSVEHSTKGGAVAYGCSKAADDGADIIIYTDCDTSVSLADLGDMLKLLVEKNSDVCIGSRRHPESDVFVVDNDEFKGFHMFRLMQTALCPSLYSLPYTDTQFPLKAFRAATLKQLNDNFDTYDFSFDIDYILQSMSSRLSIRYLPATYIHSYEASTVMARGLGPVYAQVISGTIKNARKSNIPLHDGLVHALSVEDLSRRLSIMWKTSQDEAALPPMANLELDKAGDLLANWVTKL